MRSRLSRMASRLMVVAVSLLMLTAARCGAPQQAIVGNDGGAKVIDTESTQLATLITTERGLRGLRPLTYDVNIANVAKQFTRELAHDDRWSYSFVINGQDADTRMRIAGLSFTESGHVGGLDYGSAENMIGGLIANNSFVLNESKYTRIGIGVTSNGSRTYWTILVTN